MSPKRVAVMQPYFFPYAGYFRLFAAVDHFVIFDCVQFPRRGRVHRTQVPGPGGGIEWLTLPLTRQPRDVLIREIAFAADARERFDQRLGRYPWLAAGSGPAAETVRGFLSESLESAIDFLEAGLRLVVETLGLEAEISRSSELGLSPSLRGQDRVIEAATAVGATTYVNAPGGRTLYAPEPFERVGLELLFLSPYDGRFPQLLPALLTETPATIREDVLATTELRTP